MCVIMMSGYQLIEVDDMQSMKIIVTGRVQGVGFRYFVYKLALKLDVKGTVRNLDDGRVEIVCLTDDLEQFLMAIKKGNGFSRVDELHIEPMDPNLIASKHLHSFNMV